LAAVLLAIWFSARNSGTPVGPTPEHLSFSQAQKANEQAALDVPDQFPGNIVYVSRVDFPAGGFVTIRKNVKIQTEGAEGIIGSTFFDKDTRIGNVDLRKSLVDGLSYFAQGWTDDGDAIFNGTLDKPIIKADGKPLQVEFNATKDLPEKKG
jgi:hypothetical protein